jgi:hypothetical protein
MHTRSRLFRIAVVVGAPALTTFTSQPVPSADDIAFASRRDG